MNTKTAVTVAIVLCLTLVSTPTATLQAQESFYNEAPMLAERVAAGELPPVEERLPQNPMLIQPLERVGVYGGTWRMGFTSLSNLQTSIRVNAGYENLLRWDAEWNRIIPNIAQSYAASEDASVFTFHLREGLRWSDGVPFTADDIIFWYEAELLNEELHDSIGSGYQINGVPVVVEKIDDYTVTFSFAGPYGQFLTRLANIGADDITSRPRHYLQQFHPDYNPEGIDALIAESGADDWMELWKDMADHRTNPGIPTLNAWVLTDWARSDSASIIMERNPYYWKIDTDFNQLPYIDRIQFALYSSGEELRLAAMNGQIDMQYTILSIKESNYNDWAANMTTGDYDLHTLVNPRANYLSIQLNLVHQDPVLRAFFSNKTVRIALSYAINRTEIVDEVFGIPLQPRQPAPLRVSPYYRERLETQYTEFDLARANELLDEAGYDHRDAEGYRLTPAGQRIEFTLSMLEDPVYVSAAQMLSAYWHDLGIIVTVEELENWPLTQLTRANEHDAVITSIPGGIDVIMSPGIYMPYNESDSRYAIPWVYWYENNSLGEEPPAPVREQMQLYDQLKASTDPGEIERLMSQILAIAEEEFYVMGICRPVDFYMLVRSNFHNVPRVMPKSFDYPTPAPTNPCQYFIDPQE